MKISSILKFALLFLFIALVSCEQNLKYDDVETNVEAISETKEAPKLRYITDASIPEIMDELTNRIPKDNLKQSTGKMSFNNVDVDLASIMQVVAEGNETNYTFALDVPNASEFHIYNLVIGKDDYGNIKEPYVVGYEMEPEDMQAFFENGEDYGKFKTNYRYYTFNSFFEDSKLNKVGKNGDCGHGTIGGSGGGTTSVTPAGGAWTHSYQGHTVTNIFSPNAVQIPYGYSVEITGSNGSSSMATTSAVSPIQTITAPIASTGTTLSVSLPNYSVTTYSTTVNLNLGTSEGSGGGGWTETCITTITIIGNIRIEDEKCTKQSNSSKSIVAKSYKTDDCPDGGGAVAINTAAKSVQKLYGYLGGTLSSEEIRFLDENKEQAKLINEFLVADGFSSKAKEFAKTAVDELATGEISGFTIPPSCKSFKFERVTGTFYEAMVKNVRFKIVVIEIINGVRIKKVHPISFPQPIKFGVPAVLANGSVISPGLAAELSAKAIKESINEIKDSYEGLMVSTMTLRNEFMDALRKNQREYANGGRVNFNDMISNLKPTEYQTSAFWDDKCQ